LHRVAIFKAGEEASAIDAMEDLAAPVENFREFHRFKLARLGDFMKEFCAGRARRDDERGAPIETSFCDRWAMLFAPKYPRGEHAVKKRLHQSGAEEMVALLALELEPKRFFERRAYGDERR